MLKSNSQVHIDEVNESINANFFIIHFHCYLSIQNEASMHNCQHRSHSIQNETSVVENIASTGTDAEDMD